MIGLIDRVRWVWQERDDSVLPLKQLSASTRSVPDWRHLAQGLQIFLSNHDTTEHADLGFLEFARGPESPGGPMYSGTFGSTTQSQFESKLDMLRQQYGSLAQKKQIPLHDLMFLFGVLGSLYTLVLAEKFIF
jgi:hypothetical protein